MHPVQHHGGEIVVDDGVDGNLRLEQEQTGGIQEEIEGQGELAHGKAAAPLAQAQAHDVQPAAAAAAGESDAAADAVEDAAQQAGGQIVVNNGDGRSGHHAVKEGVAQGAHQGLEHQLLSQGLVGEEQDGDVQDEVQDACNVAGAEVQAHIGLHQSAEKLAHAHQAAAVQPQGYNEEPDAHGADQLAKNGGHQPQPAVVQGVVYHVVSSWDSVVPFSV